MPPVKHHQQRHRQITDSISLPNSKIDKEECEDEWINVDSMNDREVSSTNELWRDYGERSYQQWRITESRLLRQIKELKKRVSSLQFKLKENKVNDKKVIGYLSTALNEMQLEFIKMQITNRGRPKHGRRYTAKQKSMCLAIYKQGPKLYRFLGSGFVLPTKKTLGRHSANMIFTTGVDFKVLKAVKNVVDEWPEADKYCTIMWDEVSLQEHLDYCSTQDIIEGFVQLTNSRIPKFATHALTFMVRGIKIQFKQSVGYFYTNGLFAFELVELIKLMIGATINIGKSIVV
ncbi:uncharacterized protein LOC119076602 [Bradysia coprophila]|uniref:uncharacterized protein LOC119076602 n=1 Tax=Bradysia coprophila TaxID=38358 RepID=UPI00187D7B93|nr:uncharacterized protein LOC119076602 [Bradysia coprophila]